MKNSEKIILDLCGGSGAWSKLYADAGYDVRNITLPDYDILNTQFFIEHIYFRQRKLNNKKHLTIEKKNIYGILAAPPCTMFSLARTRAKEPRDFKKGMELVIACLNIIWECRYKNKLAFWCLENPMGYLRQFLGKPAFTFDPCDFGDRYTKKTDLWGYFKNPKKNPLSLLPFEKELCSKNKRKLPSISDISSSKQSARRAITPQGFAKAFFEANR